MNKLLALLMGAMPRGGAKGSDAAKPAEPFDAVSPVQTDDDEQQTSFARSREASDRARQDQERELAQRKQQTRTSRVMESLKQQLQSVRKRFTGGEQKQGPSVGSSARALFARSRPSERDMGFRPQIVRAAASAPLKPLAAGLKKVGARKAARGVANFGRRARAARDYLEQGQQFEPQRETHDIESGRRQRKQKTAPSQAARPQQPRQAVGAVPAGHAATPIGAAGPQAQQQRQRGGSSFTQAAAMQFGVRAGAAGKGGLRRNMAAGGAKAFRKVGMGGAARTTASVGSKGMMAGAKAMMSNPVGMTIGVLASVPIVVGAALAAVKKWTDGLVESRRAIAKYNGQIAASIARLDIGDIRRNVRYGAQTSGTTSELNEAIGEFRDEILPLSVDVRNAMNIVAKWVVKLATLVAQGVKLLRSIDGGALKVMAPVVELLKSILDEAKEENQNNQPLPINTFLNELQNGLQPNRPPLQPINP